MDLDYIMKLGGSLLTDLEKTKILLNRIEKSRNTKVAYTVGSGYLGEVYKKWIRQEHSIEVPFDNSIKIWSDIQSINANILVSLNESFVVCNNETEVNEALECGKRPILDAVGFHQYFEQLKYQTTDVRTAHLCHILGCKNLVIVTDVDGIYDADPKKDTKAKKISQITAKKLLEMGRTSVDQGLAELLIQYKLNAFVIGIDGLVQSKDFSRKTIQDNGTTIEH